MATPSTQDDSKSIRVTPDVHERLQRLSGTLHNASMSDTIAWLLSPGMVRVPLTPEQLKRWTYAAHGNGQKIGDFIIGRVESALMYGSDPGTLRRLHDLVHALCKAQGIIPPATPGADRQTISPRPENNQR